VTVVIAVVLLAALAAAWYESTHQQPSISLCTQLSATQQTLNNRTVNLGTKAAYYDEQLWMGLNISSTYLSYNITAVSQNDSFGYGPAYLVNGLSDKNIWYQVGLAWDWINYNATNFTRGFMMIAEIWNATTGKSIYPPGGGSQLFNLTRPVLEGDRVALSLNMTSRTVKAEAYDFRSNASVSLLVSSYNASRFLSSKGPERFPTSVLTEWYHVLPYFCSNRNVTYSNNRRSTPSAWLEINEWNFTGVPPNRWFNASDAKQTLFSSIKDTFKLFGDSLVYQESNGTRIYCSSHQFITM